MPLYDYTCTACGTQSEISHRISDPPAIDCPACGKPALTKLVSAAGFRLKGGGWYETDFKSGNKKNLADGGGSEAKPAETKSGDSAPSACTPSGCPACA